MGKDDWKKELKNHFDNIKVLEKSKGETLTHFEQFCEFIAEPAFENLAEELLCYGVKARQLKVKGKDIRLSVNFPNSKDEQFEYKIALPRNSIEVRPVLCIKARKTLKAEFETKEESFMPDLTPAELLKLGKQVLILDVIEHYRNVIYQALTSAN